MSENILLDILTRLLGFPQAPDRPLCVQSNTPYGVAFSLPSVALSRTFAQEFGVQPCILNKVHWNSRWAFTSP